MFISPATTNISFVERNSSRTDVDCPGETISISYNCTIETNSETPNLQWIITFPGEMPLNITFNSTYDSTFESFSYLGINVSATLTEFTSEYITSVIVLEVVSDNLDGTELECSIDSPPSDDAVTLDINTLGRYNQ